MKEEGDPKDISFTTPRREKYPSNQSSTKITRKYESTSAYATPFSLQ
jgi:hypothetical protein